MKVAIISDTQYGSRQDYQPFLELNRKFFNKVFWPYLKEHNIKTIVHLGDLVEKRKHLSFLTADYLQKDFLQPIIDGDYQLHWLLGNHDIYFRESTQINASLLLNRKPGGTVIGSGIFVYDKAEEVVIGNKIILFVPWICDENREHSIKTIEESRCRTLFGHLELHGMDLGGGRIMKAGLQIDLSKFDMVLSGHYHHRSIKDNIYYVGSHAEFTWSDYGDEHGFHILETDTMDIEFIPNPYKVFEKMFYDDANPKFRILPENFEHLKEKFVRVLVISKKDPEQYDYFMGLIEGAQPLDINIVDNYLNAATVDDEVLEEAKDTLELILNAAKQANNVVPGEKLNNLLTDLYRQAQETE